MSFQDWNTVGWDKRGEKNNNESKTEFLNKQIRKGNVTQKLKTGSANQNKTHVVTNAKKIENEQDTFKHKTVGSDIAKKISQARCEKKISQKELANAIFLHESIIKEIETGKAIYNAVILNKIENYLGTRVRN